MNLCGPGHLNQLHVPSFPFIRQILTHTCNDGLVSTYIYNTLESSCLTRQMLDALSKFALFSVESGIHKYSTSYPTWQASAKLH